MTYALLFFAVTSAVLGAVGISALVDGWRTQGRSFRVMGVAVTATLFGSAGVSALAGVLWP